MMTFQNLIIYTVVLSAFSMLAPILANRFWVPQLKGPLTEDIRGVLRRAAIAAMVSGGIVLANISVIDHNAHISTAAIAWTHLPVIVQSHILLAVISLTVGPVVLMRRKGDSMHRVLGRSWVLAMYGLSFTGAVMWIKHPGNNPLIIFSIGTAIALSIALRAAFKHDIRKHLRYMTGSYIGLLVSLVFAMLPGRIVANWVLALFV